jgi:short-subunit dehydrogenase
VVTGAASGIGRAFAETLAHRGVALGLLDISADGLATTAAALSSPGTPVQTRVVDVADSAQVDAAAEHLAAELVHCAAILGPGAFAEQPAADFERVIRVDLIGTANVVRAFLPSLRRSRGAIACIASTAAVHGWPKMSAYSAAKFGVAGFCEAIRAELAHAGVGVTLVFPLIIDTPLLSGSDVAPILKQGRPIPPAVVVRKTLAGLARRRPRVFVPGSVRLVALLQGLVPSLLDWYGRRFGL